MGYRYDRDFDNTPILKIITSIMLGIGIINMRAVDGPIRLLRSRLEILEKVNKYLRILVQGLGRGHGSEAIATKSQSNCNKEADQLQQRGRAIATKRQSN